MLTGLLESVFNSDGFRLDEFPATIGRSCVASIQLADRFASRLHCKFEYQAGRYLVSDLDSRHGTYVNGERITQTEINSGDILQLGLHRFRVHLVNGRLLFRSVSAIDLGNTSESTPMVNTQEDSACDHSEQAENERSEDLTEDLNEATMVNPQSAT